jgi:ATP-binding cassette subfamily B protein
MTGTTITPPLPSPPGSSGEPPRGAAAGSPGAGRYARLLVTYLRPQRARVAALAALMLASIALELAGPQLLRRFLDAATGGAGADELLLLAVLFLGTTLLDQGLVAVITYIGEGVGWTATNAVRADLLRHCLRLDLAFYNRYTPGELIERIDGDPTALADFFSRFVLYVLWAALFTAGVLVLLLREDWRVGLALTLFTAVALAVLYRVRNLATPAWGAEREASTRLFGFLEERLAGLIDLHANGAQAYVMRRFHELARRRFQRRRRATLLGGLTFSVTSALVLGGYVLAFGLGATLYRAGAITLGTVYLIFHYTEMLRLPLELMTREVQGFQQAAAALARIDALAHTRASIAPTPAGRPASLPPGPLTVELRRVSFRYGQGQDLALAEVSLTIPAGATLGVLGRTGSGKTTLSRLLFRLADPQGGVIRLGGVDLRRVPPAAVQRRVGLVTQEVQLFHASVRDNLTFFNPAVPARRLEAVIEQLGLAAWYRALPAGLDTPLLAGRGGLSAGEAQLLALTRVFLKDPGLVILDEASARLDPATEGLVEQAIDRLLAGRTALVIAHRLQTVERAGRLLILEGGRVVEQGVPADLAADPASRFARLRRTGELKEMLA